MTLLSKLNFKFEFAACPTYIVTLRMPRIYHFHSILSLLAPSPGQLHLRKSLSFVASCRTAWSPSGHYLRMISAVYFDYGQV